MTRVPVGSSALISALHFASAWDLVPGVLVIVLKFRKFSPNRKKILLDFMYAASNSDSWIFYIISIDLSDFAQELPSRTFV